MRVIAGSAGGIRLLVPDTDVRPTMDRVKGAIFNSLGERVLNARVLDLFAGSGALGIEALSRGAASAVFVEENREAAETIEQNFLRANVRGSIRRQEVFAFLDSADSGQRFDIILADPPYEKTKSGGEFTRLLLENERMVSNLEPAGIFVLEKRPEEKIASFGLWKPVRGRRYGATEVLFLVPSEVLATAE